MEEIQGVNTGELITANKFNEMIAKIEELENEYSDLENMYSVLNEKLDALTELEPPKKITNTIGMTFTLIPAGEFIMGSPSNEQDREANEDSVHNVKICIPFYLGIYPVTQKEWIQVMESNPSSFKGDDLPVESVSWDDVQDFINKLNDKESTWKYRLPSEAEWEYACRAGTATRYSFGDAEIKLSEYAWYYPAGDEDDISKEKLHPAGQKQTNSWGLYDMHGNIWEWVQDCWNNCYDDVNNDRPDDGSAWESGNCGFRVNRGGCFLSDAKHCRSAFRNNIDQGYCGRFIGFRLLRRL